MNNNHHIRENNYYLAQFGNKQRKNTPEGHADQGYEFLCSDDESENTQDKNYHIKLTNNIMRTDETTEMATAATTPESAHENYNDNEYLNDI